MADLEPEVQAPLDRVRAALKAYSGPDDSPPVRICTGLSDAVEATSIQVARLEDLIARLDQKPVADVERAVRQSLNGLRPAYERRWRRQTVARAVGIGVAALAVWSAAEAWTIGRVYYDLGAAESHRWSAWCASPSHIATIGGKQLCQVPVQ